MFASVSGKKMVFFKLSDCVSLRKSKLLFSGTAVSVSVLFFI